MGDATTDALGNDCYHNTTRRASQGKLLALPCLRVGLVWGDKSFALSLPSDLEIKLPPVEIDARDADRDGVAEPKRAPRATAL